MAAKPSSLLDVDDALKQIPLVVVFFFSSYERDPPAQKGRRRSLFFALVVVDKRELAGLELRVVVVTKPRIFEASRRFFSDEFSTNCPTKKGPISKH